MGYIYLIHPRYYRYRGCGKKEISLPDNVYKIGRTDQCRVKDRLCSYGEYKNIYILEFDEDSSKVEYTCLRYFNKNFEKWEWGREYFIIEDIKKAISLMNRAWGCC